MLVHAALVGALLLHRSLMRMRMSGGAASEDRQMGGGPVQKPARVFLRPIVAADEASVSGFISA